METEKLLKYIKGLASQEEAKSIVNWINTSEHNIHIFNDLKAKYIASTFEETLKVVKTDKAYNVYKKRINKKRTHLSNLFKYAALIVICLGVGYSYFMLNNFSNNIIPEDAIVLQLETGETQIITENNVAVLADSKGNNYGQQKGNVLHYNYNTKTDKLIYNTLKVPYGKRFDVVLSDSTKVTLNAGSSLKYPVRFLKGYNREVFITGEAFFNVTKDKAHPFIVKAEGVNVKVLGTQFNVSSYPEDIETKTVLVEGAVSLFNEEIDEAETQTRLMPGELAVLNRGTGDLIIENVDVSLYTSWISGVVSFKHEPFKNIIRKLERYYDVSIQCNDNALNNTTFTASFNNASIEYILGTFKENYSINYTINNTTNKPTIIIN